MTDTFPTSLVGIKFDRKKTPVWDTRIQTSVSGKEERAAVQTYPRWRFEVSYELLRDNVGNELQTLMGFFLAQQGRFTAFYYRDPYDYQVTAQGLGVGDGSTTDFPLVRSLGGFAEPVFHAPTVTAVYFNGALQSTGWSATASTGGYGTDTIHFIAAPGSGVVVTADFTFNFVCRFDDDSLEFNNFMSHMWEAQTVTFLSVK